MDGVVVLTGPPCAGKSKVATALGALEAQSRVLSRRLQFLQVDALFDLLFPTSDRNRTERLRAYDGAHRLAAMFVELGDLVILECTYARQDQRSSLVAALAGRAVPLRVVELVVTPDEAVRRFRARSQPTDLDEAGVRERAARFPYFAAALQLDSSRQTPSAHAEAVAAWLTQDPPPVNPAAWCAAGIA